MAKLKQEVLDEIKADADLFSAVAKEMGVKPQSLASTIDRNGATINAYGVVAVIAAHLKRKPTELLETKKHKAKVSQ